MPCGETDRQTETETDRRTDRLHHSQPTRQSKFIFQTEIHKFTLFCSTEANPEEEPDPKFHFGQATTKISFNTFYNLIIYSLSLTLVTIHSKKQMSEIQWRDHLYACPCSALLIKRPAQHPKWCEVSEVNRPLTARRSIGNSLPQAPSQACEEVVKRRLATPNIGH